MIIAFICILLSVFLGALFLCGIHISPPLLKQASFFKKIRVVEAFRERIAGMLLVTNSRMTLANYFEVTFLLFLVGLTIGVLYKNYLLSGILAFGLSFVQYQLLFKKRSDMARHHNEKLEIYMSLVTNSYMQSSNIESAIIDSYERMDIRESAAKPFSSFIGQSAGNADIRKCLQDMKEDVDNEHFRQWCDKIVICQDNSKLKYILPYVVNRMRRRRTLDSETLTASHQNYRDYLVICGFSLIMTLLVPMIHPAWRHILEHTIIGKLAVAIVLVVMIITTAYVVKVNSLKPEGE